MIPAFQKRRELLAAKPRGYLSSLPEALLCSHLSRSPLLSNYGDRYLSFKAGARELAEGALKGR